MKRNINTFRQSPKELSRIYESNELSNTHNRRRKFIQYARHCAEKSNMRSKHGCVIVKGGKIISYGFNYYYADTSIYDKKLINSTRNNVRLSRHAEEDALRNCDRRIMKGATLYVIRWGCNIPQNKEYLNSAPCIRCKQCILTCIDKYGLKAAYYSIGEINEKVVFHKIE